MNGGGSKWASWSVRVYYALGFFYYMYQWFLIGGGIGVVLTAASFFYGTTAGVTISVAVISAALLGAGLTIFIVNLRRRFKSPNPGLKLHSSHTIYRILPDQQFEYTRELEVEAAVDGVDHFTNAFGWSGSGDVIAVTQPNFKIEIVDHAISTDKKLRVHFDRPQRKGTKFRFTYSFRMKDTGGTSRNFFRTTINEKVRRLTQEIEFPPDACPVEYKRAIFMSLAAEIPVFEEKCPINRQERKIIWAISKPRFDNNYCITW